MSSLRLRPGIPSDRHVAPSLWLDQALLPDEETQALDGDLRVDVCIVGGGYTGLWTALRLKELEPSIDVALVEQTVCGAGASGRNSGFLLGWWRQLAALQACCGAEEGLRLARRAAEVADAVHAFCADHAIDADLRRSGWLWAATNSAQLDAWKSVNALLERYDQEIFDDVSTVELERLTGTSKFVGAVIDRTGMSVQPALLARGLRRVAVERGVNVFEWSPMTALGRSRPPQVVTASGTITANTVVLAMNAWLLQVREAARSFFVIAGDMIATAPIPQQLEELGWTDGAGVSDARLHIRGARTTSDGRVVYGLGGTSLIWKRGHGAVFDGVVPTHRADQIKASFAELYPHLAGVEIARTWTGPVDKSATGLPFFGRLNSNADIIYGAGFSGNGVGPTYLAGHMLAAMALRRDDEWAHSAQLLAPRRGLPPEPLRYLGGRVVKAAVARSERLQQIGRRPDALTRALVARVPGRQLSHARDTSTNIG